MSVERSPLHLLLALCLLALGGCPPRGSPTTQSSAPPKGDHPAQANEYVLTACDAPRSLSAMFGGANREIRLQTDKPGGITDLPVLKTEHPLYGVFSYGQGEGRLNAHLVLDDASPPAGVYDLLYLDTNFDGRLADEKPVKLPPLQEMVADYRSGEDGGNQARVVLAHESLPGGSLTADAYYMGYGDVAMSGGAELPLSDLHSLSIVVDAAKSATAKLGDQEYLVVVTDEDGDGDYGDVSAGQEPQGPFGGPASDVVYVDLNGNGRVGEETEPTALAEHLAGSLLSIGGTCYSISVSDDATKLRVAPVDGPTGSLTAPPCEAWVDVRATDPSAGPVSIVAQPGEAIALPAGTYELMIAVLRSQDGAGQTTVARMTAPAPSGVPEGGGTKESTPTFEVAAGSVGELVVGPPFSATVETKVQPDGGGRVVEMELKLVDAAGLAVRLETPGEAASEGIGLEVTGPNGKVYEGAFRYG